jgi:hypothetical protein
MLKKMCEKGQLLGFMSTISPDNPLFPICQSLLGGAVEDATEHTANEAKMDTKRSEDMPMKTYELIRTAWNVAHTEAALESCYSEIAMSAIHGVFPRKGVRLHHLKQHTRSFSDYAHHCGNSSVKYRWEEPGSRVPYGAGFIQSIWRVHVEDKAYTFAIIRPHSTVLDEDWNRMPYATMPRFRCVAAYAFPTLPEQDVVIEPKDLVSHLPYYERHRTEAPHFKPFGIDASIRIFVDSLQRGRE